jgi:hypothetical protein
VNGESKNAGTILSGQSGKPNTPSVMPAKGETTKRNTMISAGRSGEITITVWFKPLRAVKKFVKLPCEPIENAFKTKNRD